MTEPRFAARSDGWTGTLAPSLRCDYCGDEVVGSDAPSLDAAKEAHRENCPPRSKIGNRNEGDAAGVNGHDERNTVNPPPIPDSPGPPGHSSPEAGWSSLSSASTEGQIAARDSLRPREGEALTTGPSSRLESPEGVTAGHVGDGRRSEGRARGAAPDDPAAASGDQLELVPRPPKLSTCRSCRRSIIWTRTERGKKMPLDADPVVDQTAANLFVLRERENRDGPLAMAAWGLVGLEDHYVSHFATCPNAGEHRSRTPMRDARKAREAKR